MILHLVILSIKYLINAVAFTALIITFDRLKAGSFSLKNDNKSVISRSKETKIKNRRLKIS